MIPPDADIGIGILVLLLALIGFIAAVIGGAVWLL